MRKKLRDWPVQAFQFWVRPECAIPEALYAEGRKRTLLWNELVLLAAENAKDYQRLFAEDAAALKAQKAREKALAEYEQAKADLNGAKKKHKTRSAASPELGPYIDALAATLDVLRKAGGTLKAARKAARISLAREIAALQASFFGRINDAVRKSGIYWADAQDLGDRFKTAWRMGLKTGSLPKPQRFRGELRFLHRFTGGGVQIEKIFSDTPRAKRLKITPVGGGVYESCRRGEISQREMKRQARTTLYMQICGYELVFRTILHRDIPAGSILKSATLKSVKAGKNTRWSVSLVVEMPPGDGVPAQGAGVAGIDVGWRVSDDTIRVAVVSGDDTEEICLPPRMLKREERIRDIQRERDGVLEAMKKQIPAMLPADLPAELKANWHMARQGRFVRILRYLSDNNPGHFLVAEIDRWRRKDRRMVDELAGLKARNIRDRRAYYYNTAHRLCRKYGKVVVENLDLAAMARRTDVAREGEPPEASRFYSRIAAVGSFTEILKTVAGKTGTEFEAVDPQYTTMKCNECGEIVHPADRAALHWECPSCGAIWDQDVNAARNLGAAV